MQDAAYRVCACIHACACVCVYCVSRCVCACSAERAEGGGPEDQTSGRPLAYLHGDVGDGGGGQVEVLLHQDVELGGQVAAGADTVHLAGEQRRDLGIEPDEAASRVLKETRYTARWESVISPAVISGL